MQSESKPSDKPLGFWSCWSFTVGIMIGSGVFLLPSSLAAFGTMSFWGWAITACGSICLALVVARLAQRTRRSGGVYRFSQDAFGDLVGFLVAWGYWCAYWIGIPAMAIAFVGYLAVFVPSLNNNPLGEAIAALILIWSLTFVNIRGVKEAGTMQLFTTLLKLIPLLLIIALGLSFGEVTNLPEYNPQGGSWLAVAATTALMTMWAFSGLEAGAIPASDVKHPEKTIPKAIIFGTLVVAFVYVGSTMAVMMLVPADQLVTSTSPFSDAAQALGSWGPMLIAVGALISTAGAVNGTIFLLGQIPMSVALDKLAPPILAKRNKGQAPVFSLLLASTLGSICLLMNYTKGLLGMFTFLVLMSTSTFLIPILVCALAELKHSWRSARAWSSIAALTAIYSCFAILGSGVDVFIWGILLILAGLPLFYFGRRYQSN